LLAQLAYLLPYFKRHRCSLITGIGSILLSVAIGILAPLLVGRAVDTLRTSISQAALLRYGGLLVAIAAAQGVFTYLQRKLLVTMSRDVELELRDAYFAKLEELSLGFFQRHTTGDLMARATNDLGAVRMLCGPAIMYSSRTVFTAAAALTLMIGINAPLTALALATMPVVAWATNLFGRRIHQRFEQVQEGFSDLSTEVQENLAGARVLRAYAQEGAAVEDFSRHNQEYVARNVRLIRWSAAFHPTLMALVGLGFVAVLWYGGLLVVRGAITVGQFVTFNLFLSQLVWPMIAIGWVINLAQRGSASLGRIRRVLESAPEIANRPTAALPAPIEGAVAVRGLRFVYPAVPAEAAAGGGKPGPRPVAPPGAAEEAGAPPRPPGQQEREIGRHLVLESVERLDDCNKTDQESGRHHRQRELIRETGDRDRLIAKRRGLSTPHRWMAGTQ
jgi:ATP-binding cassette subfamily B protein